MCLDFNFTSILLSSCPCWSHDVEDLTDFPLAEVAVRKCSARRYLTITFALLGEGEVNQNANVCEPGGGGIKSIPTFTYNGSMCVKMT